MNPRRFNFDKNHIYISLIILIEFIVIAYLFYGRAFYALFMLPMFIIFFQRHEKKFTKKIENQKVIEFKEMISSLASSLGAGYSLEKGIAIAKSDIYEIYGNKSHITKDLDKIINGLKLSISFEELIEDFYENNKFEQVREFANVIRITREMGGNTIQVIKKASKEIAKRIEVSREIETIIAKKVLEQKVMSVIPFFVIGYLKLSNKGYLDILYGNILGIFIMSVFLIIIFIATYLGERIVDIKI